MLHSPPRSRVATAGCDPCPPRPASAGPGRDGLARRNGPRHPGTRRFTLLLTLFATLGARAATPTSDPTAPVTDPALQIPADVRPRVDVWMRDAYVTPGHDGYYYLTGTTAAPGRSACWDWNDGIRLWHSRDLKTWEPLGLVWSLDRDATWQKTPATVKPGERAPTGEILGPERRAVWAPEIHYIRHQWLIAACMNGGRGSFILRSTSGRPEGPYVNIPGNADGPIFGEIDPSLFEDDDGAVYFVGHNHYIARMKDDLSGLAEPPRRFRETPYAPEPYAEGVYLVKWAGRYQLVQTYWSFRTADGRYSYVKPPGGSAVRWSYDVVIASAASIYGPYGPRYTALVGGGHDNLFRDDAGHWWSTAFGNPRGGSAATAPFLCRPALVPMRFAQGRFLPDPAR